MELAQARVQHRRARVPTALAERAERERVIAEFPEDAKRPTAAQEVESGVRTGRAGHGRSSGCRALSRTRPGTTKRVSNRKNVYYKKSSDAREKCPRSVSSTAT